MPHLFARAGSYRSAAGVFEGERASFFMRPPGDPPPVERETEPQPFELFVRSFGGGGHGAPRLLEHVRAWDVAGRPGTDGLRVRAFPIEVEYVPGAPEQVIAKRWTRLVLDWPAQTDPRASGAR